MSSKRRLRRKMCEGKTRFPDESRARWEISKLAKAGKANGYLTPYRCYFCKAFHFGHPPRRVRQAMSARHG